MAKKSNSTMKLVGIVLLVVGIGLAFWGYQMSGALGSQLTKAFSGSMPDAVMYRYIGGAACFFAGLFLTLKK
jgi:hypothetical protein